MTKPPIQSVLEQALAAATAVYALNDDLVSAIKNPDKVTLEELKFDSLAWMEFCISIELSTGVELTPEHLSECETLADVATWIQDWPGK